MAKQSDTKEKARSLFLTGQYSQKEIAEIVGSTEKTISEWKIKEGWEDLQTSMLTSRENELRRLYRILKSVNESTERDIDEGKKVDSKDADAVIKYTAAIKNLELETSIAEKVEVGTALIEFVRKDDVDMAQKITKYFDLYLQSCIR